MNTLEQVNQLIERLIQATSRYVETQIDAAQGHACDLDVQSEAENFTRARQELIETLTPYLQ
jgi:hypothetical protein